MDEEVKEEAVEEVKVAEPEIDPKDKSSHPPVMAQAGHRCSVEGCGFEFGHPANGVEPHPLHLVTQKPLPTVEPPKPTPPPPKESTAKCEPVHIADTCGKCGWSAETSQEPHPVRA